MSAHSLTDPKVEHANADLVAGLRELADFIEQHPELPKFNADAAHWIYRREHETAEERRGMLGALATALGDRATEIYRSGDVIIEGEFTGGVRIFARCPASLLREPPPEPDPPYEPIIGGEDRS